MKIILLSGGAGKRLWPLSTGTMSKQFLKMMKDEDGRKLSMIQNLIARLKEHDLLQHAVIAAPESQIPLIRGQVGSDIACVAEPERRDTFPAIALAASYLADKSGADRDEIAVVLPADGYADASFYRSVVRLAELLKASDDMRIGLLGASPSFPSDQYGYITLKPGGLGELQLVSGFKEKPGTAQARQLIAEGALWNCGVFAFRIGYMLDLMDGLALPSDYAGLRDRYSELPARSFDYEVVEKETRIGCLRHNGSWKDLGNWNAVADDLAEPMNGPGLIDTDSQGTIVLNELSVPVLVSGVQNAVIVAGQQGILVCSKESTPGIKTLVERLASTEASPAAGRNPSGRTSALSRNDEANSGISVGTWLHHVPTGCELRAESDAERYVWILTSGSGVYRDSHDIRPAAIGSPYTGDVCGGWFVADSDAVIVETLCRRRASTEDREVAQ